MPIIEIDGLGRVEVDDSFLKLSPADQDATVKEIASGASGAGTQAVSPPASAPLASVPRAPSVSPSRKDAPGSGTRTSQALASWLTSNFPELRISGTDRTPERNAAVGGAKNSFHLYGQGVDFVAPDGADWIAKVREAAKRDGLSLDESMFHSHNRSMHIAATGLPEGFEQKVLGQHDASIEADHNSFRTELQKRFDAGASLEDLQTFAKERGGYGLEGLEQAVQYRDKGGKGASVAPVQSEPEQDPEGGPSFFTRQLGALNEGIADTLGAPVDLVNAGLGAIGLPVSDQPFLGSDSIREGMHWVGDKLEDLGIGEGLGQPNASYAPRSALERYTQAASRGVGQAAVSAIGLPATGARLAATAGAKVATKAPSSALGKFAEATKGGSRTMALEAAKNPSVAVSAELASGAGSGLGGQAARDIAPGNATAEAIGAMAGGLAGGLTVGRQAAETSRPRNASRTLKPTTRTS